jgi:hypothetical protein
MVAATGAWPAASSLRAYMWLPVPRDVDGGLVTRITGKAAVARVDEKRPVRTRAGSRVVGRVCEAGGRAGRAGRTRANGV